MGGVIVNTHYILIHNRKRQNRSAVAKKSLTTYLDSVRNATKLERKQSNSASIINLTVI